MQGASFASKCAQQSNSNVWSCALTRSNNYQAEAIWNPSESCSNGFCKTAPMSVPSLYVQYRTIGGQTHPIQNHTVPVGAKPVLLENQ